MKKMKKIKETKKTEKNLSILVLLCLICVLTATAGYWYWKTSRAEGDNREIQRGPAAKLIDVDLTILSSTMVYGEMYNMTTNPDKYMGKVIKAKGSYSSFYYEAGDKYYHYLIIADVGGCCEQGLEFIWNGERTAPDDYPKSRTWIEVTGVFKSYEERGYTRHYLAADDIKILK